MMMFTVRQLLEGSIDRTIHMGVYMIYDEEKRLIAVASSDNIWQRFIDIFVCGFTPIAEIEANQWLEWEIVVFSFWECVIVMGLAENATLQDAEDSIRKRYGPIDRISQKTVPLEEG